MSMQKAVDPALDEVFVLSGTGKREWWSGVLSCVSAVMYILMAIVMAQPTVRLAFTNWIHVKTAYEKSGTLAYQSLVYFGLSVASVASLCKFTVAKNQVVQKTDSEEQPDEALLWEWCVPCGMLRPPDASHCRLCQKCIRNRYYHATSQFKCVSDSNVKWFLVWMVTNLMLCRNLSTLNRQEFGLFSLSILGLLWTLCNWCALQVRLLKKTKACYPKELFKIVPCVGHCVNETQPKFSFSTQRGRACANFCPTAEGCAASQRKVVTRCPRPGCNAICNQFWVTDDEDGIVECNICQATFKLPEEEVKKAEVAPSNEEWLVHKGDQKPTLVFLLDTPAAAAEKCRAVLDGWVKEQQLFMDVDVVTHAEDHVRRYRQNSLTHERYSNDVTGYMNLNTILDVVSGRGGRIVLVRESSSPLAHTALVTLGRAARSVPFDVVCLTGNGQDLMPPDLSPALLHQIQRGGGTFCRVCSAANLISFLRRPVLVPWGVKGSIQVITSLGLHVTLVSRQGVSEFVNENDKHITFKVATLSESTPVFFKVEVNASEISAFRRLTDPQDSRVFAQLVLTYTRLDGRVMRRIYNKAFEVTVGEALTTLTALP